MQTLYKAEFFDRDFNFKLFSPIPPPEINVDYLTLDKSTIQLAGLPLIERGWYCHITQGSDVIYQGIVSSVSKDRSGTVVQLLPLVSLFDFQFYRDRSTYTQTALEEYMLTILVAQFYASDDEVQKIKGLSLMPLTTSTDGIALNLKDNVHDFWDNFAKKALELAQIVVVCSVNPQTRTVSLGISNLSSIPPVVLEADLPNVIEQNFTFRDDYGSVNKCVIINEHDESEQATFYASDYAAPTVCRYEKISVDEGVTFAKAAADKASELLRKSEFDNLIELTYRADDKLIPDVSIGQSCMIIKNGIEYNTILTGYSYKGNYKKLIFGSIRIELTKILKMRGAF